MHPCLLWRLELATRMRRSSMTIFVILCYRFNKESKLVNQFYDVVLKKVVIFSLFKEIDLLKYVLSFGCFNVVLDFFYTFSFSFPFLCLNHC